MPSDIPLYSAQYVHAIAAVPSGSGRLVESISLVARFRQSNQKRQFGGSASLGNDDRCCRSISKPHSISTMQCEEAVLIPRDREPPVAGGLMVQSLNENLNRLTPYRIES